MLAKFYTESFMYANSEDGNLIVHICLNNHLILFFPYRGLLAMAD